MSGTKLRYELKAYRDNFMVWDSQLDLYCAPGSLNSAREMIFNLDAGIQVNEALAWKQNPRDLF